VCESVHQTSQASSSPSPTPPDLLNPDLEDEQGQGEQRLEREEQTAMECANSEFLMEQQNLISNSLCKSPPGPQQSDGDLPDPVHQRTIPQASTSNAIQYDDLAHKKNNKITNDRNGATFSSNGAETSVVLPDSPSNNNCGHESVISGSTSFQPSDKEDNSYIQQAALPGSRRPQSASCPQKPVILQPFSRRPKTAVDSASRKAVRFADQPTASTEVTNGKREKEAPAKSKKSCRPHSLDSGFYDRDDPEDDGSESRGSKTFLTQQPGQSLTRGTAQADNSPQPNGRCNSGKKNALMTSSPQSLEPTIDESTKTKSSQLSTLQEIYGPKSASLTYVQEHSGQSKKQSTGKKRPRSNIKQRLDERFAEYAKIKGKNTIKSTTKKFGESSKEKNDNDDADDEREIFDKYTELQKVVKKFFKPADFSNKSQKSHKPQHAQSHKAKVLKLLQAKANTRPSSAATYSDRIVSEKKTDSNKPRTNLRPKSSEMFAEKTDILSKHGLIKSHAKSDSTKSQRPKSGSYLVCANPRDIQSSKTEKQTESD
ncbi:hypothetical protein EGW08_005143, partial [Elysia chlorotica]